MSTYTAKKITWKSDRKRYQKIKYTRASIFVGSRRRTVPASSSPHGRGRRFRLRRAHPEEVCGAGRRHGAFVLWVVSEERFCLRLLTRDNAVGEMTTTPEGKQATRRPRPDRRPPGPPTKCRLAKSFCLLRIMRLTRSVI